MVFVIAMLVMASSGAVIAATRGQRLNMMQAVVTLYLVTTGLLTARRSTGPIPAHPAGSNAARPPTRARWWIDPIVTLVALTAGLYEIKLGTEAMNNPRGTVDGIPATLIFIFGSVPLLAALGDARMIWVGGFEGTRRITRHLWRMCFAAFIATGSFFLGQGNKAIPPPLRILPLLAILAFLPLGVMVYWLLRVSFTR